MPFNYFEIVSLKPLKNNSISSSRFFKYQFVHNGAINNFQFKILKQMKIIRTLLLFAVITAAGLIESEAQTNDKDLVYAAIEDYVDALYLVQPERIKKSVHPNLTKKGYWRPKDKNEYAPESTMTYNELVELAGKWNAKGTLPKDAVKKIEIFDVQNQTAVAKLTAHWGTDYFHLGKYDGKWMIVNVLWQSPPQSVVNN